MTVNDVITQFRYKYPACTEDYALTLFNQVHKEFASRSQMRNKWVYVDLTAGEPEYDMPAGVKMIHESYYQFNSDPGSWFPLVDTSIDEFIEEMWGWQLTAYNQSMPTKIYTTTKDDGTGAKFRVGLWLCPNITTDIVTGYPRLAMRVTSTEDMDATDDLPTDILNELVYVYGMCKLWSFLKQPEDYPLMKPMADAELDKNIQFVKGLQVHKRTQELTIPMLRKSRVV